MLPWTQAAEDRVGAPEVRAELKRLPPERLLVLLMEAQRRIDPPGIHATGGIQLTSIERDMITTKIIHRWPDVIGQRVLIDAES